MFELLAGCDKEVILSNVTERCIRKEAGSSPVMTEAGFLKIAWRESPRLTILNDAARMPSRNQSNWTPTDAN